MCDLIQVFPEDSSAAFMRRGEISLSHTDLLCMGGTLYGKLPAFSIAVQYSFSAAQWLCRGGRSGQEKYPYLPFLRASPAMRMIGNVN